MNILVTGASGQLGNSIKKVSTLSQDKYIFTDINLEPDFCLDITDSKAITEFVKKHHIECIINCAAYTNVDKAECEVSLSTELNALAPLKLANAMREVGGLLVHISTDYVFDSSQYNSPISEDQSACATGIYAKTKLLGEQNIINSGVKYLILRSSWMYSEFGKNFCKTIFDLSSKKDSLSVVFDQVGTPTYAPDLAAAIVQILDTKSFSSKLGVYNYSNEGVCSWFDFAQKIVEYSTHICDVRPIHSNEFPSSVVRPAYSVLDKSKFKKTFGIEIPYWTDSLKLCINNLLK